MLAFDLPDDHGVAKVIVRKQGGELPFHLRQTHSRLTITLREAVDMAAGEQLTVETALAKSIPATESDGRKLKRLK
jgi:hypothetical protein